MLQQMALKGWQCLWDLHIGWPTEEESGSTRRPCYQQSFALMISVYSCCSRFSQKIQVLLICSQLSSKMHWVSSTGNVCGILQSRRALCPVFSQLEAVQLQLSQGWVNSEGWESRLRATATWPHGFHFAPSAVWAQSTFTQPVRVDLLCVCPVGSLWVRGIAESKVKHRSPVLSIGTWISPPPSNLYLDPQSWDQPALTTVHWLPLFYCWLDFTGEHCKLLQG